MNKIKSEFDSKPHQYIIRLLESGHNKALKNQMVNWVGDDQHKFDALFNVLFTQDYRMVQRAAWPITYIVEENPALINKHLSTVTKTLEDKSLTNAVKRNLLRFLQKYPIPKKYSGRISNACFSFLTNPSEKAAVKAFSITVLENISKHYPELKEELGLILEDAFEQESPAFRSRAKKVMRDNSRKST